MENKVKDKFGRVLEPGDKVIFFKRFGNSVHSEPAKIVDTRIGENFHGRSIPEVLVDSGSGLCRWTPNLQNIIKWEKSWDAEGVSE